METMLQLQKEIAENKAIAKVLSNEEVFFRLGVQVHPQELRLNCLLRDIEKAERWLEACGIISVS